MAVNASGSSGTDDVTIQSRRRRSMKYEGSGAVDKAISPVNVGNDDDGRNVEDGESFGEETFDDYVPIANGELVSTVCIPTYVGVQGMFAAYLCIHATLDPILMWVACISVLAGG